MQPDIYVPVVGLDNGDTILSTTPRGKNLVRRFDPEQDRHKNNWVRDFHRILNRNGPCPRAIATTKQVLINLLNMADLRARFETLAEMSSTDKKEGLKLALANLLYMLDKAEDSLRSGQSKEKLGIEYFTDGDLSRMPFPGRTTPGKQAITQRPEIRILDLGEGFRLIIRDLKAFYKCERESGTSKTKFRADFGSIEIAENDGDCATILSAQDLDKIMPEFKERLKALCQPRIEILLT